MAVGLALGDELLRHGNFEWVRVADKLGEETCVAIIGLSAFCAPISMIQKRIARGEEPDFVELRKATIAKMEDPVTNKTEKRKSSSLTCFTMISGKERTVSIMEYFPEES